MSDRRTHIEQLLAQRFTQPSLDLDRALAGISRHANKPLHFLALTVNADQARTLLDDLYVRQDRGVHQLTMFERCLVDLALDYLDWHLPRTTTSTGGGSAPVERMGTPDSEPVSRGVHASQIRPGRG